MYQLLFNLFEENPGSKLEILFENGKRGVFDYHDEDFRNQYKNFPQLFKVHSVGDKGYMYINSDHITVIDVVN
jgi:hypothetical protein